MDRRLIVTHHAPDLDAIGAVWLLKRFDSQHYADAKVTFVNPGETLSASNRAELEVSPDLVTHVDTGLGEFDHHQPDRGQLHISASSLVFDYVVQLHPDLANDGALKELVAFITEIDHFGEIEWPESDNLRNSLMIHELIRGMEFTDPHNDESQLHFGMQCLDNAYANFKQHLKAQDILNSEGIQFELAGFGPCIGLETRNDDVIKLAQKRGFMLVVRKDPEGGHIRIKARPDTVSDLQAAATAISTIDQEGTWYYHPSGKMLINGSRKHQNQTASPLGLIQVIDILKRTYGK